MSFDIPDPTLDQFGVEAAEIQNDIYKLYSEIQNTDPERSKSLPFHQALSYYHAILLDLFNTFDYYHCWHLDHSPYLSRCEINHHVNQILQRAEIILDTPGGCGLLLILPLRVAGTRAETDIQKATVQALLDSIFKRGFIVAARIKDDLHLLWDWKGRLDSPLEGVE